MREAVRTTDKRRTLAVGLVLLIALAAVSVPALMPSAEADATERSGTEKSAEANAEKEALTELVVEGVGTRSVNYDGAIGRFTVSVLRDSLLTAVADGNKSVQAIADEVAKSCTEGEPKEADHTTAPTCISPTGLQTVGIRIEEEFDWTEQGRVSRGFRYENGLKIAIRGTGFAGGLVDMVIKSGGQNVRFDGIDFTVSRRAQFEQLALLDAIDDARSTARAIAKHMDYEIVRIVSVKPGSTVDPYRIRSTSAEEAAFDDSAAAPTPVFGGADVVTSRVTMVYELRPKS